MNTFAEKVNTLAAKVNTFSVKLNTLPVKVDTSASKVDTLAIKVDTSATKLDTLAMKVDTLASQGGHMGSDVAGARGQKASTRVARLRPWPLSAVMCPACPLVHFLCTMRASSNLFVTQCPAPSHTAAIASLQAAHPRRRPL